MGGSSWASVYILEIMQRIAKVNHQDGKVQEVLKDIKIKCQTPDLSVRDLEMTLDWIQNAVLAREEGVPASVLTIDDVQKEIAKMKARRLRLRLMNAEAAFKTPEEKIPE